MADTTSLPLAGKVALVTGSSGGIGEGIAERLAKAGADIVVNYRSHPEGADEAISRVRAAGRRATSIRADLSIVADVRSLVQESIAQLGRLDILVNNAGIEKKADFVEVTEEDYDRVLDVNLKGAFFAAQAFAQYVIEQRRPGRIINISSVHEDLPFPGFAPYCLSKGGMRMLTRNLAVELAPHGITVNGIAPGAIATPINAKLLEDKPKLDALLKNIPLARLGKPEDVAGVVAFLASPEADYITGATLFVDGGLTQNYHEQ